MSRRAEQMASNIRDAIQQVIDRGLSDPRISGLITVTGTRVTDDLRTAIVSISVLPGDKQELTMHGLKAASRHIRRQAGDLVAIKQMPELLFKLDQSLKKQAGVLDAIARASEDLAKRPPPMPVEEDAPAGETGEET